MEEKKKQESQENMQFFGAYVIGPSGSGKSTLCEGLSQFFTSLERKYIIINLDPANDALKYKCEVDIRELIVLDDVMEEMKLGPNGALLFAINFLLENIDWLLERIAKFPGHYLVFDLPGQVELYLNTDSMNKITEKISKNKFFKATLAAVELFDCVYAYDPAYFISTCLLALNSMMNLCLPHVNVNCIEVLSKIDMVKEFGKLDSKLATYTTELSLEEILMDLQEKDSEFSEKYKKLNKELAELVDSHSLVSFFPLDVSDKVETRSKEKNHATREETFENDYLITSNFISELEGKLGLDEN